MKLPVTIGKFEDFINQFPTLYMVQGELVPTFCLNTAHYYYWTFVDGYTEKQLNEDIKARQDLHDWNDSAAFYYANDNMFSPSNEQRGIKGKIGFRNGKPYVKK